jgi:hypothetical protein
MAERARGVGRSLASRFWEKVDVHGPIPTACPEHGPCWIWLAGVDSSGYGQIDCGDGRLVKAARASLMLQGEQFAAGECALHHCDVRRCCNPGHLYKGTKLDNGRDKARRGRARSIPQYGESNPMAVLTEENVLEVRVRYALGETLRAVAVTFGVSESLVSMICSRKLWRHV